MYCIISSRLPGNSIPEEINLRELNNDDISLSFGIITTELCVTKYPAHLQNVSPRTEPEYQPDEKNII